MLPYLLAMAAVIPFSEALADEPTCRLALDYLTVNCGSTNYTLATPSSIIEFLRSPSAFRTPQTGEALRQSAETYRIALEDFRMRVIKDFTSKTITPSEQKSAMDLYYNGLQEYDFVFAGYRTISAFRNEVQSLPNAARYLTYNCITTDDYTKIICSSDEDHTGLNKVFRLDVGDLIRQYILRNRTNPFVIADINLFEEEVNQFKDSSDVILETYQDNATEPSLVAELKRIHNLVMALHSDLMAALQTAKTSKHVRIATHIRI
jgi:hypothetical protein